MIPIHETMQKLFEITGALAVLSGAMAWWRRGSAEEDAVMSEAADVVLDGLSDADAVNKIGCVTGKDLRDQLTIEEAIELDRERNLRRFGRRN